MFVVGVICAAPVLGGWYRAQTIACYDETDEVLVKFVDYGGYSKIPAMDLRQIRCDRNFLENRKKLHFKFVFRSDFMTLPFQATECCLAHIKPIDGIFLKIKRFFYSIYFFGWVGWLHFFFFFFSETEGWSSKATAFFEECVHAKVVEALVVGHVQDNISLVELSCTVDNEV